MQHYTPHLVRFLVFAMLAGLMNCGRKSEGAFRDEYRWLSGKWQGERGGHVIGENWQWNRHRFEGTGYELNGTDTVFSERIYLINLRGRYVYVADVPNQTPVMFNLSGNENGLWEFSNDEHDFPSQIAYRQVADTLLGITLRGHSDKIISYQLKRLR